MPVAFFCFCFCMCNVQLNSVTLEKRLHLEIQELVSQWVHCNWDIGIRELRHELNGVKKKLKEKEKRKVGRQKRKKIDRNQIAS